MEIIDYIRIGIIIVLSGFSAYTDLRNGKIGNNIVIPTLILALIINIIYFSIWGTIELLSFIENAGSVVILSLVLYFTHIWAGGDSKLIIAMALLTPVRAYWQNSDTEYTLWYMVALMFIVGFLYLLGESLVLAVREHIKVDLRQFAKLILHSIVQYVITLIYIAALGHIYMLFPQINIPAAFYTCICILAVWGLGKAEIFSSKVLILAVLVFDIAMSIITGTITVNTFWPTYLVVIAFMIIRAFINKYNYKTISTCDVSKGMVLSQASSILLQKSRVQGLPNISDETLKSRLTESEAESVRRWEASKYGLKEVIIVRKMPFGIFAFCGAILYFILRGVIV